MVETARIDQLVMRTLGKTKIHASVAVHGRWDKLSEINPRLVSILFRDGTHHEHKYGHIHPFRLESEGNWDDDATATRNAETSLCKSLDWIVRSQRFFDTWSLWCCPLYVDCPTTCPSPTKYLPSSRSKCPRHLQAMVIWTIHLPCVMQKK